MRFPVEGEKNNMQQEMYYSVDKIEGGYALLIPDEGETPHIAGVQQLPPQCKEGDMLLMQNGVYLPAPEKTHQRREEVKDLLNQLLQGE